MHPQWLNDQKKKKKKAFLQCESYSLGLKLLTWSVFAAQHWLPHFVKEAKASGISHDKGLSSYQH